MKRILIPVSVMCVVGGVVGAMACGLDVVGGSTAALADGGIDGGRVGIDGALFDGGVLEDATPDAPSTCTPTPSFDSDPRNCGRCGHDCFGGTCVQSACTAWTIAANLEGPYGIASDGMSIFVTLYQGNKIVSCPVAGCGASAPTVVINATGPTLIAVSGTQLVWGEYNTGLLDQCTLPNCTVTKTNLQSGLSKPDPGAVEGGELFWPNFGPGNAVMRCTLPTCTSPTPFVIASSPDGVAVNASTVFYSEFLTNHIFACPRATGCTGVGLPKEIASQQAGPTGLAVDANRVYWANNQGDGGIVACPLAGCGDAAAPSIIAGDERAAVGVVVVGERILWTNWLNPTGTVRAIAKP